MILGHRHSRSSSTRRCNSCGHAIHAGEKYHRAATKEDFTVWNYREHVACEQAARAVQTVLDIDPPPVSEFDLEHMRALLEYDSALYSEVGELLSRSSR